MDELAKKVAAAAAHVEPEWDSARASRVKARLERTRAGEKARRYAVVGALAAVAAAVGLYVSRTPSSSEPRVVATVSTPMPDVHRVSPSEGAEITLESESGDLVAYRLASGAVDVHVAPAPELAIRAGDVEARARDADFSLSIEADEVVVRAVRGSVGVVVGGESRVITAGSASRFPLHVSRASVELDAPTSEARRSRAWRRLAEEGQFDRAFGELRNGEIRDVPEELLLAADAARLSGHPEDALRYLRRMLRTHANDPRAPLASFTMGRVLMSDLGRPREAAQAFEMARRGPGALAEDALAREVEAWARAGEAPLARERAEEYVRRFPNGQRVTMVRRWGELDP
jgi:transmembrane sensor